ncbi:MAG: hypothetical protein IT350_02705 [Deltaproteobacteria bacterium]|nr:hypothetical protein [Deltaproteobacteria bacterium]
MRRVIGVLAVTVVMFATGTATALDDQPFAFAGGGLGIHTIDAPAYNDALAAVNADDFRTWSPAIGAWFGAGLDRICLEGFLGGGGQSQSGSAGDLDLGAFFIGLDGGYAFIDTRRVRAFALAGLALTGQSLSIDWSADTQSTIDDARDSTSGRAGSSPSTTVDAEIADIPRSTDISRTALAGHLALQLDVYVAEWKSREWLSRLSVGGRVGWLPAIATGEWRNSSGDDVSGDTPDASASMSYVFLTIGGAWDKRRETRLHKGNVPAESDKLNAPKKPEDNRRVKPRKGDERIEREMKKPRKDDDRLEREMKKPKKDPDRSKDPDRDLDKKPGAVPPLKDDRGDKKDDKKDDDEKDDDKDKKDKDKDKDDDDDKDKGGGRK